MINVLGTGCKCFRLLPQLGILRPEAFLLGISMGQGFDGRQSILLSCGSPRPTASCMSDFFYPVLKSGNCVRGPPTLFYMTQKGWRLERMSFLYLTCCQEPRAGGVF